MREGFIIKHKDNVSINGVGAIPPGGNIWAFKKCWESVHLGDPPDSQILHVPCG